MNIIISDDLEFEERLRQAKRSQTDLLHAAAGQTGLFQYECKKCQCEVFTKRPVELLCQQCDQTLVGTDII